MLQDPIALAEPLGTDLHDRPHTQIIMAPKTIDGPQKVMIWLLAVVVALFFGVALAEQLWGLALIAGVIAVLVGFATWIMYKRAAMSWSATWHRDRVVVEDGRYGSIRTWEESLAAFNGIARGHAYLRQGNAIMPNLRVHGVILEHPEPHMSVLLHAQRQPISDDTLVGYARQLGTTVIG